MTAKEKQTTGPRAVGDLIRWRKGPAEGVSNERPKQGENIVAVIGEVPGAFQYGHTTGDLHIGYLTPVPFREGCDIGWGDVRYWIPWADIAPGAALSKKGKRR